eukprot:scaffold107217_cov56-Phaeocystis_antarctica.AAC.1
MSRPTLQRRNARRCGPVDASLGRSRWTRSHLRQISSAADVTTVKSSERNSKTNSNGSIPGQPTMFTTSKRGMSEAMPGRTVHKCCKKNSAGAAQASTAEVEVSTLGEVPSSMASIHWSAVSSLSSAAASLGDGKSLARDAAVGCRKTLCTGRQTWKGSGVFRGYTGWSPGWQPAEYSGGSRIAQRGGSCRLWEETTNEWVDAM